METNPSSSTKEFVKKRICIYAGKEIDPMSDEQVSDILKVKFNIFLPQRQTLDESLRATNNDHEIIGLILQYRSTR
jgi:DNA polymerase I-like protein with 3'-5' exonuclease and polymerase domains